MTADLFAKLRSFQRVPMSDAEVYYLEELELDDHPAALLKRLIAETPWRAEEITVWGKKYAQPRLIAWYGDGGRTYTYSGIKLDPLPWTGMLVGIKRRVERAAETAFNSVLLNYYRDSRDSMGFHSDDEPELGKRPVIASLSLGETRTFVMKPKQKGAKSVKIELVSGSLLLMKGDTQQNWQHGIEKETRHCGPRVNLTFRRILS